MNRLLNGVCLVKRFAWGVFSISALLLGGFGAAAADLPKEPDVLRATLTNGLQVIIVQNPLAPVVTTVINYRVGSDETPEGFPGTAHALEHMMFRGSPGLSGDQLADVSAALGGDFNADTQQAVTQYFFTTPAEDLDLALHVEAARMGGLAEDEKLWEKERGAIEQEVAQDLSNPEYVFYTKLLQIMFRGTPYEHDALGTRSSFDKTTGADLRKFHTDWYQPNNGILVVAGDVPLEPTLAKVKEIFARISSGKLPARPEFNFQPVRPDTLRIETDLPYGMVAITFRFPGFDSPDFAAAQVLSDVLSSRRGDLYGLVPEGKALMANFSYETLPRAGLGYGMVAYPAEAKGDELLAQLRTILLTDTTNGFAPDLVEAAKRREIASAEFQRNSVSGLAMEWSSAVAIEGRNSPQDDVEAFRKVTVADVNRVAKELLNMDHAVSAILTPQPSGKPVSTKSFGGAESFASGESKGVKLPDWATAAMNRLDVPKLTVNPTVTNLPNGLKLIIQPEAVSDTVCVYGHVKNRPKVQMAKGKDGVDQALDQLFSFGTKSLDRLAFEKALDEIGATESAGADFSLQVLTADFDRGMQLLADNQLSPALPGEAFKMIQPALAGGVAGELESPGYRAEHFGVEGRGSKVEETSASHPSTLDTRHSSAPADMIVIDCSFISLRKILPPAVALLRPSGNIVALIKPQFEAGKAEVDKGEGVITDPAIHERVLRELEEFVVGEAQIRWRGVTESPLLGPAGNKEFLVWIEKAG